MKKLLMKAYKKRKLKIGSNPFILNIEELATIWHFPMSHVATPLLQKAKLKTAEPPSGLPVENLPLQSDTEETADTSSSKPRFRTDSGDVEYVDDDGVKFG